MNSDSREYTPQRCILKTTKNKTRSIMKATLHSFNEPTNSSGIMLGMTVDRVHDDRLVNLLCILQETSRRNP